MDDANDGTEMGVSPKPTPEPSIGYHNLTFAEQSFNPMLSKSPDLEKSASIKF